jgi:hypothetical protein
MLAALGRGKKGIRQIELDVDLWIGLPARVNMRVINLCQALGARLHSPSAVILPGEHVITFLYAVTGLNLEFSRKSPCPP